MSIRAILLPVFIEVALTFVLLFRASGWFAMARGRAGEAASAAGESSWQRELELPVLFYVLTILAWHTQFADLIFLLLAWVFVALRVLNAFWADLGRSPRESFFLSSAIVLAVMWVVYAVRLLLILG